MRQEARKALADSVNDLTDALGNDAAVEETAAEVRERLSLLLERDRVEAERVERFDKGARVRVNMTRGDGVRDSDDWTIEAKGEDQEEAAAEFDALLERYVGDWSDEVRELQPAQPAD